MPTIDLKSIQIDILPRVNLKMGGTKWRNNRHKPLSNRCECGRPALFKVKGGRLHAGDKHSLCHRCFISMQNALRQPTEEAAN
jgi:hypothetical protein